MEIKTINLKDYYNLKGGILTSYIQDYPFDDNVFSDIRPAIIICPGGNYEMVSKREGEPVALKFLALGYNVFILKYLAHKENVSFPEELLELACSVDYIKKNHKEYKTRKDEIFLIGFSAGGHLACSLSTDYTIAKKLYKDKTLDCSVKASGLIYPVINDDYGYSSSHKMLLDKTDNELIKEFNAMKLDELVNKNTVPTFLFSTFNDATVPSLNSVMYAKRLAELNIPYELHVYKNGVHGQSTFDEYINQMFKNKNYSRAKNWIIDCASFFKDFTEEIF